MNVDKLAVLRGFTIDELKEEIHRRRTLERAKQYLPNAEASLLKAQKKLDAYNKAIEEDRALMKRRLGAGK